MAADASANDEKTPTNKSPSSPLFGMLEAVSSGSMKLIVEPTLAVTEGAMKVTDGAVKATANVARSIQSEIDGSASSKRATEKGAAVKVQAAMRGKAGRDTAKKEMAAKYPASSSLEVSIVTRAHRTASTNTCWQPSPRVH